MKRICKISVVIVLLIVGLFVRSDVQAATPKIGTVKLSSTRLAYNGKVRKPTVIVKNSNGNKISSSYYTVTYAKGRKYVGKYKVTIKFKGKYSGTYKRYFEIVPKKTSIKSLAKTQDTITVNWYKRTTQTTGYEIRYSRYKDFSSYGTKRLSAKYTSKKLTDLKPGTKYYIKIRTYKTVNGTRIYSGWSDVKTITTKSTPITRQFACVTSIDGDKIKYYSVRIEIEVGVAYGDEKTIEASPDIKYYLMPKDAEADEEPIRVPKDIFVHEMEDAKEWNKEGFYIEMYIQNGKCIKLVEPYWV